MPLYVNTYEVDREYGGPEEGGWWFTTYTPVASRRLPERATLSMACKRADMMNDALPRPRFRAGSVLYRGGECTVRVEDHPAKAQPEQWPHYE